MFELPAQQGRSCHAGELNAVRFPEPHAAPDMQPQPEIGPTHRAPIFRDLTEIVREVNAGFLRDAACYPGYADLERRHGLDLLPDEARVFAFLQVGQFRIERFLTGFRRRCPAEAAALDVKRARSPERAGLTLSPYVSEARLVLLLSDLRQLGEAAYRAEDDGRDEAAIWLAIGS